MSHIPKIGLFFGSFDPIHLGHLIIAESICNLTDVEKIWFVISPQNPLKTGSQQSEIAKRIHMATIAIEDNPKFLVCDIETQLDAPFFTINTLRLINKKHPCHNFVLILGGDNLEGFDKWKDYREIIELMDIYVYPRHGTVSTRYSGIASIKIIAAPRIEISSTLIRQSIQRGNIPKYMLPKRVYEYIKQTGLYLRM